MRHHTAETPLFWLQKRLDYAKAWSEDRHKKGRKISFYKVIFNPIWAFIKQYLIDGRFLKGKYGLIYSLLFMQYTFNKYAILYDLTYNKTEQAFIKSLEIAENLQPVDVSKKQSSLSLVMIVKMKASI